jgi:hypothetical protein
LHKKKQKIFELLSDYTKDEFIKFGQFIKSPYFNNLNNVVKLYSLIKRNYPQFTSPSCTSQKLFGKIFPGIKYNDVKMRVLYSQMFTLAEKFIAVEKYLKNGLKVQLDIAEEHRRRGNNALLESAVKRSEDLFRQKTPEDSVYYDNLFRLKFEKNHLGSQFKGERDFVSEAHAITAAHIIKSLWIYSTIYNIKNSLNINFDETVIDSIEHLAELPEFSSIPAVKMNYFLYRAVRYMEEDSFFKYIDGMNEFPFASGDEELYQSHILLLNFCVIKIRGGKKSFAKTKFELYKNMIEKQLWDFEKFIPYTIFNNIVSSAIENNEHDFGFKFIGQYGGKLDPAYENSISCFCYAKLYYSLEKHDKALNYLSRTGSMDDIFYKFAVRDLNLKIFYETGRYEQVISIIDSYRHLISRSKLITPEVKSSYRLFLKYLNDLLKPGAAKSGILLNLEASQGFVNRDWLIKMAGMLNISRQFI